MALALWPVDVVYVTHAGDIITRSLHVAENSTVGYIIQQSGILQACSEIDLNQQSVGIFSRKAALDEPAFAGARIEIYRPLRVDPKTARRKRAIQRRA